jgi:DNA-binding NarL/FixJ family response regulator
VVGEAADGETAVALAARLRPQVVLLDSGLPGLGSVEVTGQLSAEVRPAVLLLAADEEDDRVFPALRAGAGGVLVKDAQSGELVRAVELVARGDALVSATLIRRLIDELFAWPEPRCPSVRLVGELTAREREVVRLVALGLSNREIAERLVVSSSTSKTYVSRAMVKIQARDRAQLAVFGHEAGLAAPAVLRVA